MVEEVVYIVGDCEVKVLVSMYVFCFVVVDFILMIDVCFGWFMIDGMILGWVSFEDMIKLFFIDNLDEEWCGDLMFYSLGIIGCLKGVKCFFVDVKVYEDFCLKDVFIGVY